MTDTLRLGTRGSDLARTQSGHVAEALTRATGRAVEIVVIRTRGDKVPDRPLAEIGGKGLFTKEIEDALLSGEVDLAVHSMKDMPTEQPEGLVFGAVPLREDARDALVGSTLDGLATGAVVGTGSPRRRAQLLHLRPDLDVRGIRGNVPTRIARQEEGRYAAVVLAMAGLRRLGLEGRVAQALPVEHMVPAVGQGALAVQVRAGEAKLVAAIHHPESALAVEAERAFLVEISGGCSAPVACHARLLGHRLEVHAFAADAHGAGWRERAECAPEDAAETGRRLAAELKRHVA